MTRRADYLACYDAGRRYHTRHFLLFVRLRPDTDGWRLGTAVSRKMGGAVRRNRIKRVIREVFRLHTQELRGPLDIVAVPKRHLDAKRIDLAMAEHEILPMFQRIQRDHGTGSVAPDGFGPART